MTEQSTGSRPERRVATVARDAAPAAGAAGAAGVGYLAGWPAWLQLIILGLSTILGVGAAANTAIARGRRQQSMARHDRVSTDDHANLVGARKAIMLELAKPGLGRRRRRDLERTLQTLTDNPLHR